MAAQADCCLSGGFTVLSTKAVSTLLTTSGFDMFKQWVAYVVLAVSGCGHESATTDLTNSPRFSLALALGK